MDKAIADLTQPIRLKPSKLKILLLLVGSLLFTVAGYWVLSDNTIMTYLCCGFFGLGVLVSSIQLIPNSSYLELSQAGFTFCSLFRAHSLAWSDIDTFLTTRVHHNDMVGWIHSEHYNTQKGLRSFSKSLTGVEAGLPDTYGMKAKDLADLMNKLKNKYT